MTTADTPKIIVDGLSFPEGPRWHDGCFYFSDFYRYAVQRINEDGSVVTVARVPKQPSGLGWLPDGRMLIVSMLDRKLLRRETDGALMEIADLHDLAPFHCNDMVVDAIGRAYIGNFGFDTHARAPIESTNLIRVDPDGSARVAAADMTFPNGTVITPDGRTLIIAETHAKRITAFDIDDGGALSGRRVWADCSPHYPDGICLDAEGAVWLASPLARCFVRIHEGGEVVQQIDVDRGAYACALGDDDRRTLYLCTSTGAGQHAESRRDGRIETTRVDVPGVGLP